MIKQFVLSLVLISFSVAVQAEDIPAIPEYTHVGKQYPPVLFQSNIEDDAFVELLKEKQAFAGIDKDAIGSPVGIRVVKGLRIKQDATAFSSLMLSASTLGLIPVVTNKAFKVQYGVFVQGELISYYEYEMSSADVENMWGGPRLDKLKPAEQLFLEGSVNQFLLDLKDDSEVQGLFSEYYTYFK